MNELFNIINFNGERHQKVKDYLNSRDDLKQSAVKGCEAWRIINSSEAIILSRYGKKGEVSSLALTKNFPEMNLMEKLLQEKIGEKYIIN